MTEWRPCYGYPDYEISEFGSVRRISTSVQGSWKAGREKTQWLRNGYLMVKMPGNKSEKVHRLVTLSFLGEAPSMRHEVAHGDGIKTSNHYSNLRWATRRENMQDAMQHGTAAYGERSGRAKLTRLQVEQLRSRALSGLTQQALAAEFGISSAHVCGILSGKYWPQKQGNVSSSPT